MASTRNVYIVFVVFVYQVPGSFRVYRVYLVVFFNNFGTNFFDCVYTHTYIQHTHMLNRTVEELSHLSFTARCSIPSFFLA